MTDAENNNSATQDVVVGVDGSEVSRHALSWAARYAKQAGLAVRAVGVWHIAPPFGRAFTTPEERYQRQAQEWLDGAVAAVRDEYPDVEIEGVLVRGQPVLTLLDYARDAEVLVLGNKGRGAFTGMLLGSVAQQCLHHADVPVVVVR